jgi:transcriptional regulator with XRE-family HTH domain
MGNRRPRPERVGEKLLQIRVALDISQSQMPGRLGLGKMHAGRISEYENNLREPALTTLLAYADLAGVHLEDIVNDKVNLPEKLPGKVHHGVLPVTPQRPPKKHRVSK